MVPTKLIRISRYYMVTALFYLFITLAMGLLRAIVTIPDPLVHWAPAVLGWVSFPIMGAYYQFFPTLQGKDLRFENLALPQYMVANLGLIVIFLASAIGFQLGLVIGFGIYAVAVLMFAAIILGNTDWSMLSLTLRFFLASLTYFVGAVALLFLRSMGIGPMWADRPFVLHIIVFGWATLAVMGAEYIMVPMLQLKALRHPRLAEWQFYLINLGFLGLAYSFTTASLPLIASAGTLAFVGILVFAYNIFASLAHGPARLRRLDISVKYFMVGIVYLIATVIASILMAAFHLYQLRPIHLHLGLIGFLTMTIVGAMYHIVPFVVWWEVYASKLGSEEVPLLHQLYNHRSATWQLYGLNAGLLTMIAGFCVNLTVLVAAGGTMLVVVSLAFATEMLRVLGHRRGRNSITVATNHL
ncbi:MAG: hypothetical protein Q7O66_23055 [Dehalococcoidia bacterium]|nr:hypothetical protein [Dehalococcoidia bacterium]